MTVLDLDRKKWRIIYCNNVLYMMKIKDIDVEIYMILSEAYANYFVKIYYI